MVNKKNVIKESLISAVIRFVSREGLENLTTRGIATESGVSERYIFLYFGTKDELLTQTFESLDIELFSQIAGYIKSAITEGKGTERPY